MGMYRQRLMRLMRDQPDAGKARFDGEVYEILKRAGAKEQDISYIKNPPAFSSLRLGLAKRQRMLEVLRQAAQSEFSQRQ
jgi:hypothetical protein